MTRLAAALFALFLALAACGGAEPHAERFAPLTPWEPDARDEQALTDWERHGGDPGAFFIHRYPAPDASGAYPVLADDPPAR